MASEIELGVGMYPYRLLAPGPVAISPETKKILSQDMIHHRSPAFQNTLEWLFQKLPEVFETDGKVYLSSSSGSGAMEAAMLNFISKEDKVLIINSGKFGERWLKMAQALGCHAIEWKLPWGKALDLDSFRSHLKEHPDIKAVFSQYCETSTGILHPIKQMAEIKKELAPNALFIVDVITAILTYELKMKDWGLDVCVAGSQKAFMLPPGLSMLALSPKAEKAVLDKKSTLYFDLNQEIKAYAKKQTAYSSNVPLIRALEAVLKNIFQYGKERFISETTKRAEATRKALEILGLETFPEVAAPALTTIKVPEGIDGKKMRNHIEEKYNMTFMGGQDQLEGKVLRIGHMGYIRDEDILASIEILCLAFKDFGVDLEKERALKKVRELL